MLQLPRASCVTGAITLRILKSVTFGYDSKEDRILVAINAGHTDAWSCWLTRRLILALLERAPEFLANSSALAKRATPEARKDVAAFEREAAIVKTAPAMSQPPPDALRTGAGSAALAQRLTFVQQGDGFRLEIRDDKGDGADGPLTREEFQRILAMLQVEAGKAQWIIAQTASRGSPAAQEVAAKPVRH